MIDLIIPAYNAEDTIGRALGSILAQTRPRKFVVTVVDDCSTDATAAIVKKFKGLLPINYIKLENNLGRPGLVRNVGIENTHCDYIMFLDADDILDPMAAEIISRAVLQNRPDMIIGSFYKDNRSDNYKIISTNSLTWLHGNAYSRNFLNEYNIRFDDNWNEDGSFNLRCGWLSNNKYCIEKPLSYWMDNRESVTRKDKDFMFNIAEDYIETYLNAIEDILIKKSELSMLGEFQAVCAHKLAEFLQFYDTAIFRNGNDEEYIIKLYELINSYVNLLYKYDLINREVLLLTNQAFNSYNIFIDTVRQNTLINYLSAFKIEWSDYVK